MTTDAPTDAPIDDPIPFSLPGELGSAETLLPIAEQLGFGGLAGFAAGYAAKKLGKLVAIALGLLFIALQLLAFYGFVSIEWGQIQATVDPLLEAESLAQGWRSVLSVLTYNLPFAAAFAPAFVWGLRRG